MALRHDTKPCMLPPVSLLEFDNIHYHESADHASFRRAAAPSPGPSNGAPRVLSFCFEMGAINIQPLRPRRPPLGRGPGAGADVGRSRRACAVSAARVSGLGTGARARRPAPGLGAVARARDRGPEAWAKGHGPGPGAEARGPRAWSPGFRSRQGGEEWRRKSFPRDGGTNS